MLTKQQKPILEDLPVEVAGQAEDRDEAREDDLSPETDEHIAPSVWTLSAPVVGEITAEVRGETAEPPRPALLALFHGRGR